MKTWSAPFVAALMVATSVIAPVALGGCADKSQSQEAHYVSPKVEGASARINLEEVQKAFWSSKGSDFNTWMGAFEKRVNEIYDGAGVVSIDADRKDQRLFVTGFVDKDGKQGFGGNDEKLFSIEQTGPAANDQVPMRVANGDGQTYYQGQHSLLDNPFLQAFLISSMLSNWGGRYHTAPGQVVVLRDHRDGYRATGAYKTQQASNRSFNSRFKQKADGSLESTRKFGDNTATSSSTKRRTWGSTGTSASTDNGSASSWSGRRSTSGSDGTSGSTSSWGSRRSSADSGSSSSSSSGSLWGGRRSSSSGYRSGSGYSSRRSSSSWGGSRRRR